jgi:hypothetical protein
MIRWWLMPTSRRTPRPRSRTLTTGGDGPSRSASPRSSSSGRARQPPTPVLPSEWREFLSSLTSCRVRFVIVGAHALAALGCPRNTLDLDVLIEPSVENARRFGDAVRAFGLSGLAAVAGELARGAKMTRIGRPPLRIDVMNRIDGVTFEAAWKGRRQAVLDGLELSFLGEKEFRRNKRAAGRPKDLLDLELLDQAHARPRR